MSVAIDYTSGAFAANKAQKVGTITAGTGTYNLGVAAYDGVSFSVAGEEVAPNAMFFGSDGTKLYVTGSSGDDVNEYDLSSAWDVSSASYVQTFSVSTQDTATTGLFFKDDGSKMFVVGVDNDNVNEYTLSTPWDISSASYVQNFNVLAQDNTPRDLFFKPDGLEMYIVGLNGKDINQYTLSAGWDISTASYTQNFSVSAQETTPTSVFFTPGGDRMFVVGVDNDNVNEYTLSTPWDISSASYVQNFNVYAQESIATGLFFKSDGSKMYIVGSNFDTIHQYSTGTATTLDVSSGQYFDFTPTADTTFAFSNAPASGTAAGFALAITGAGAVTGYDIVNMSQIATTDQFDATGPSNLEQDMLIRDNGTDIFILDYYGIIWHYSLATAFDVNSTATLVRSLDVKGATGTGFSASATDFRGFTITPDGTQVVMRGDDPTIVLRQFSLATAWDLSSTKTLVGSYTGLSSVSGATDARGIKFANSGTLATVGGNNIDRRFAILELSTPYDISSVSSTTTYNLNTNFGYTTRTNYWVWGSQYSNDGKKLIITSVYGYEIVVIDLATAYDPSSYTGFSELQYGGVANIASLSFTSDGGKAVSVRNNSVGDISSYTTGSTALATFTYPSSVDWPSGTAPDAPAVGETDVLVFYTDDGGATYYGFQAGDAMS